MRIKFITFLRKQIKKILTNIIKRVTPVIVYKNKAWFKLDLNDSDMVFCI